MDDFGLYNSKFKVYPDGLIVATYADKPKFRLQSDEKKKKQKVDRSFLNWSYSTFLFTSITYFVFPFIDFLSHSEALRLAFFLFSFSFRCRASFPRLALRSACFFPAEKFTEAP